MYLTSNENNRLQQVLTNVSAECNCKSCQALSKEKGKLKKLLNELAHTQAHLIQSEKMAALGKLAAGLLHELNNPIGALNSSVDVCNRSVKRIVEILNQNQSIKDMQDNQLLQLSEVLESNNSVAIKASERVTKILDGMRNFVRMDESTLQKIDLHELLDNILTLFNRELNNRISVVKKYGNVPIITCHAAELNQVLINLFRNAVESISGRRTITIQTIKENNNICIKISDSGIGIPPEKIQNLFEPTFSKKENRVKASFGLFISLNIVRKHKGQIKVASEVGKGSAFTVIMPEN